MEKEKIYNLKLTKEELTLLEISLAEMMVDKRKEQIAYREEGNFISSEKINFDIKKYSGLLNHLNLVLRYQGENK